MSLFKFSPRSFACLRFAVVSAALFFSPSPASHADGELTLELPPSQAAQDIRVASRNSKESERASAPIPFNGIARAKRSLRRSRYASRSGYTRQTSAVGTLGVFARKTPIYREHEWHSAMLTQGETGTYVALRGTSGNWYGVLMADGSTGWVPKSSVKQMAYEVVSTGANPAVSMGEDPDDIYPRSANVYFQGDPQALLNEAYRYLGVRYVWGGNTANGIDCSGFVKNVFATQGFRLPRLGSDQMAYGVPVPKDQLQAGDRLYFGRRTNRVGVTHTGLYIGGGYFIHASSSRHGVAISHLSEDLFARIYVCARR